ncbi:unnamed protein product (macronuclear) [Paramecium tetraurelia]|uniref:Calcium-dependent protein kinase 1 n=1 Tax=Paramecium tetraurelia TaxID=5888 RepID=A0DJR9_PARTE|nr:uncharacterized protein GSPATT00017630001 [Paramecium tetraurelia]CAK83286.1 unnamed protein product [Paramecium tetraurelia]|eukprot:XP_001450683.1 hypothetical protein (macronuclear) [Paramecium tetraurelia strain d4-2]
MGLCQSKSRQDKQENLKQPTTKKQETFEVGPDNFATLKQGQVTSYYRVEKSLGQGAYGEVRLVIHKQTGQRRAMKQIKKDKIFKEDEENLLNEVTILKQLDHPNIVKLYELFQDKSSYYLITEYLEGGELLQRISEYKTFTEKIAAEFLKQILSAVMYCHERKIVHRDLKPENILLESIKQGANLKIIDFGTSRRIQENQFLTKKLGTPYYIAPEVLKKKYNEKCDVWSCGVILYQMLSGKLPFDGQQDEILSKIDIGYYDFPSEHWSGISDQAISLIKKMMEKEPNKRITAKQAYEDPWIQHNVHIAKIDARQLKNLQSFYSKNKVRTALMQFITTQVMTNQEKEELITLFKSIDKNGDGLLSKEELLAVYSQQYDPLKAQQMVEEVFEKVDINKTGAVDFTAFVSAACQQEKMLNKIKLEQTFKIFDINGDGQISKDELQEIMGGIDDQLWQEILQTCDGNGDGEIQFEEFITYLVQKY